MSGRGVETTSTREQETRRWSYPTDLHHAIKLKSHGAVRTSEEGRSVRGQQLGTRRVEDLIFDSKFS